MLIRAWRASQNLTLKEAARRLGLKSFGQLSEIERGITFPNQETVSQIEAATNGAVRHEDHQIVWRKQNRQAHRASLAAGRSAARAYRPPADPKTRMKQNG